MKNPLTLFCPRCGKPLLPGDYYCAWCGRPKAYDIYVK